MIVASNGAPAAGEGKGGAAGLGVLRERMIATGARLQPSTLTTRKVVIVGCGAVGMACALSILHRGCMEELVLVDIAAERLEGEVMDLRHGLPFLPRAEVHSGTIEVEGRDADLVVITAGVAQQPGQSRLDLIGRNAELFRRLLPSIAAHCPRAVLLVVSNPVDVLTHIASVLTGFPHHRVIGSGTVLDSARLRMAISRRLGLDPRNIHAYVIGEHGDSEVPVWSRMVVAGMGLMEGPSLAAGEVGEGEGGGGSITPLEDPDLADLFQREVRGAAQEIIRLKGSTSWAIGLATAEIVEAVLRSKEQVLTVSGRTRGLYDLPDVCLSLPTVVSEAGAVAQLRLTLHARELEQLRESASLLRHSLAEAGF